MEIVTSEKPMVTKAGALSMQVCVPADWTDEQATKFANSENLCGTTLGWVMRHTGDPALDGKPERVECSGRPGFVHIMLDA